MALPADRAEILKTGSKLRVRPDARGPALVVADPGDNDQRKLRNLNCSRIEVDEVWGFIGMKQKTAHRLNLAGEGIGDIWTWIAIERFGWFSLAGSGLVVHFRHLPDAVRLRQTWINYFKLF